MREDDAFQFQAEGEVRFTFFVFILDRISPRRNCCEIMAQRGKSEPLIPIPPKGFLFSEHC